MARPKKEVMIDSFTVPASMEALLNMKPTFNPMATGIYTSAITTEDVLAIIEMEEYWDSIEEDDIDGEL